MKGFFLVLFVWGFGSSAGLGDSLRDQAPSAVDDHEVSPDSEALEDAVSLNENSLAWDIVDGNEEWQQKHQWVETGHSAWQSQGCPVESADPSQVVELDSPSTSRLWDTVVTEFSGHSENENSPVTDKHSAPSTVDTITSQESMNIILPSEENLDISAKKNLNVNISSAAQPEFRTSSNSSHLVSSTLKPSRSSSENYKSSLCPLKPRGILRPFVPLQRSPPFCPISPPLQMSVSSCKFSPVRPIATRTTQTAGRTLQRTRSISPTSKCHKHQRRIKVISPTSSCPIRQAGKRTEIKQRKCIIKPMSRSCEHKCSKRKPVLKDIGLVRQCRIKGSCRSNCVNQHKIHKKPRKRATNNKKDMQSKARRLPVLRSHGEVTPNKMVIYIA